ncbi:hypothetical protein LTR70_005500 [Exophiala xenobiotica]|uniref:Uncharacterized protein n=1 Tax=Lithohypha guttulata TaxID=1690604 RepID=A0ABR0KDT7_9EURO|nr:hypothetical protein LTR24_003867 [Lithohypha guttulata]KAK5318357.1 hypothetical protein LTR70_005500 [Exophiala xenobiotica]
MSSYLFYSSPPPAAYREQQRSSFFTPQAHRTTPFAAWSAFHPKSPSPLRASHVNAQRRQPFMTDSSTKHSGPDSPDENSMHQHDTNAQPSSSSAPAPARPHLNQPFLGSESMTTSANQNTNIVTPTIFSSATVTAPTKNPFQFQQKARDSSAPSQLSNRTTAARSERKSAFVNRLRNTRRNDRDDRHIDSFEKAEYWRERRQRDERMQRDARRALGPIEEEIPQEVEMSDNETETGQLSPVSEEKEVEELVNAYYEVGLPVGNGSGSGNGDDGFEDDLDLDYEEAFMEVLSQEQGSGQRTGLGLGLDLFARRSSRDEMGQVMENSEKAQDGDVDMT